MIAVRRSPLRRRRRRGDGAGACWLVATIASAIAVRRRRGEARRLRGSIELPDAGARPWQRPLVRIGQQCDESLEGARSERCSVAHAHVEGQRRFQRRGEGGPLLVGHDPLLPVVGLEGREASSRRRGGRSRRRGRELHGWFGAAGARAPSRAARRALAGGPALSFGDSDLVCSPRALTFPSRNKKNFAQIVIFFSASCAGFRSRPLHPSAPPPAPQAIARRAAPPPRRWRRRPGSPSCHRASQ